MATMAPFLLTSKAVTCATFIIFCQLSVSSFIFPTSTASFRKIYQLTTTMGNQEMNRGSSPGPLENLCSTSLRACDLMTPLIASIYNELILSPANSGDVTKVKKDNSAFTIADGTVQRLLINCLFSNIQFRDIVGEEDEAEDINFDDDNWWYQVQGLAIPKHMQPLVDTTRNQIEILAKDLLASNDHESYYETLAVFIDPIDGTREFASGKGEQCSICIGFADEDGKAIAGVVYRPLSKPAPTWVSGAKSEDYSNYYFGEVESHLATNALLSTNGSISPFLGSLIEELDVPRIKSGGAGNKMMMLLEQSISTANREGSSGIHGHLYIQDRGVSRWDTCAAEACLEAFGGQLLKLTDFLGDEENDGNGYYTYRASEFNLDFLPNTANLTKYNSNLDISSPAQKAQDVSQVKPYSNLCGLVAFGKEFHSQEGKIYLQRAITNAASINPPSLD